MSEYDVEVKKVDEVKKQLYRDYAIEYNKIKKSELSQEEKQTQINELNEKTKNTDEMLEDLLMNSGTLSEISSEEKETLGIKEPQQHDVDMNVVDTLVSIYVKKAKMPKEHSGTNILEKITLREDEQLEKIDTTDFEKELKQYFIEHYNDLLEDSFNNFLSSITEVADKDSILHEKNGELIEMAIRHGLDPEKFHCFGYQLTVQDGLVAEEDNFVGVDIFYATPKGINNRIYDIYSELLYIDNTGVWISINEPRKLKNNYITYAEENGIQIENPDVLETLDVDIEKVQALAKFINRVINSENGIESGDYTKLFEEDITKNYSKIMNMKWYDFGNLKSIKDIAGKDFYTSDLHLSIEEDHITRDDEFKEDIAYGTPEFVKKEYEKIMQEVNKLHQTNAFTGNYYSFEKITAKKQAYRRYIQENGIEGIDTFIPKVEIDHNKTKMIADAIMQQYGEDYEDKDVMTDRILAKLESNWAEIKTEAQVMSVVKLFDEELKEMGQSPILDNLYIKDDFIYLGSEFTSNKVIYATEETLKENLDALDREIARKEFPVYEKKMRKSLVKYAEEQGFKLDIPSVKSIENRRKQEQDMLFGSLNSMFARETIPDDPTAREKINLNDSFLDVAYKMSEGVPGGAVAISSLMNSDPQDAIFYILDLDDMNIRGSQIWVAYKYLYHENGEEFAKALKNRDKKIVDFVNEEMANVGGEKAVSGGASFDRNKFPGKYRFTEEDVEFYRAQKEARIEKQKLAREKMIANSPSKKKNLGEKRREKRAEDKKAYREALIAKGKRSIKELDEELTDLKTKEQQAKELYEQYEEQLPNKAHEEV